MNRSINLALLLSLCCFVASAFIIIWSPDIQSGSASSFAPEKNSTLSNSSANSFESNPVTTIIIPNENSRFNANSSGSNNVTNVPMQSVPLLNSLSSTNKSTGVVKDESDLDSSNDFIRPNISSETVNNDTISDSQQRGEYLTDNNGIHYYNINNCSEKKGSSGIGDLSECEDAVKEMSEE
jgi:hypothetical protein